MLRHDVVEACVAGKFHIYSIESIYQALELLTERNAGDWSGEDYPEDSVLGIARRKAREFWEETVRGPQAVVRDAEPEPVEETRAAAEPE